MEREMGKRAKWPSLKYGGVTESSPANMAYVCRIFPSQTPESCACQRARWSHYSTKKTIRKPSLESDWTKIIGGLCHSFKYQLPSCRIICYNQDNSLSWPPAGDNVSSSSKILVRRLSVCTRWNLFYQRCPVEFSRKQTKRMMTFSIYLSKCILYILLGPTNIFPYQKSFKICC